MVRYGNNHSVEEFKDTTKLQSKRGWYVKAVYFKSENDQNSANTEENTNIPHHGDGSNPTAISHHLTHINGLYCNYTPVLNDSLIKISCRYTACNATGSYPIWNWGLWVAKRWITGGWERHYAMGTLSVEHKVYCNSWGSGKQLDVTRINSYKNRIGLAYIQLTTSIQSIYEVEEYRNANPYGQQLWF